MTDKPKRIKVTDEDAFKVATGLAVGSVRDSGNLRLVATEPDGTQKAIEIPYGWLIGDGGLRAFITTECKPGRPA